MGRINAHEVLVREDDLPDRAEHLPGERQGVLLDLSNYATIQLRDELARLQGVGDITYLGQRDYSMRIWFEVDRLTGLSLTPADIVAAIQKQNRVAPVGRIGGSEWSS